jgi:hypothetical protein
MAVIARRQSAPYLGTRISPTMFNSIIRGGTVVDGLGGALFTADIAI